MCVCMLVCMHIHTHMHTHTFIPRHIHNVLKQTHANTRTKQFGLPMDRAMAGLLRKKSWHTADSRTLSSQRKAWGGLCIVDRWGLCWLYISACVYICAWSDTANSRTLSRQSMAWGSLWILDRWGEFCLYIGACVCICACHDSADSGRLSSQSYWNICVVISINMYLCNGSKQCQPDMNVCANMYAYLCIPEHAWTIKAYICSYAFMHACKVHLLAGIEINNIRLYIYIHTHTHT